jgi:hypothetical protein
MQRISVIIDDKPKIQLGNNPRGLASLVLHGCIAATERREVMQRISVIIEDKSKIQLCNHPHGLAPLVLHGWTLLQLREGGYAKNIYNYR